MTNASTTDAVTAINLSKGMKYVNVCYYNGIKEILSEGFGSRGRKAYTYAADGFDLKVGDEVIVATSENLLFARVVEVDVMPQFGANYNYRKVLGLIDVKFLVEQSKEFDEKQNELGRKIINARMLREAEELLKHMNFDADDIVTISDGTKEA